MLLNVVAVSISLLAFFFSVYTYWSNRSREKVHEQEKQAGDVSTWFDSGDPRMCVLRNGSQNPVYDVVLTAVAVQGAAPHRSEDMDWKRLFAFAALPPGDSAFNGLDTNGGMGLVFQPEVAFRDSKGVSWVRRADGSLEVIPDNPIDYYKIGRPVPYHHFDCCNGNARQIIW